MKEEEFKRIVNNTELPDIKAPGHQRRLKMALLETDYLFGQSEKAIQEPTTIKGVVYTMKETMKRALTAEQPIWKTATLSILALALVLGLSLTIPGNTKSVYAQAEETILASAKVKDALGGEEIQVIRIDLGEKTGKAVATGGSESVLAKLDLKTNSVTEVSAIAFKVDDQIAIEIAKTDPRVQEILDTGASIGDVSTLQMFGQAGNYLTGEVEDISETIVMVEIIGVDVSYIAHIDMMNGTVTKLLESIPGPPPTGPESSFIKDTEGVLDTSDQ